MNEKNRPTGMGPAQSLAGGSTVSSVAARSDIAPIQTDTAIYGTSTLKIVRRTNRQLASIDDTIMQFLTEEHPATLRGTFYRVMSAGAVEKSEAAYRLIGRQVLKLRRAGRLPQSWITDGTRYILKRDSFTSLDGMLDNAARSYRRMLWADQPADVQIFTEKEALTGVISSVTDEWDVPLGVLRGYSSESFAWSVAEALPLHKATFMYQLGDHDPSGVDAWRNFSEKVAAFAPDADVTFIRLAVLPEQITLWNLPTRPTKRTDTRAKHFIGGSVEVDAIPPNVLRSIIRQAIERHVDADELAYTRSVEANERDMLHRMIGGTR